MARPTVFSVCKSGYLCVEMSLLVHAWCISIKNDAQCMRESPVRSVRINKLQISTFKIMFLQTCSWNITRHILLILRVDGPAHHATKRLNAVNRPSAHNFLPPLCLISHAHEVLPQY